MLDSGKRLKSKYIKEDQEPCIEPKGIQLEQHEYGKLLGLVLDKDLSFDNYVENLCKKISRRIVILNNIKSHFFWS